MSVPSPGPVQNAPPQRSAARRSLPRAWAGHLASFLIPGITLAFLLSGPHPWYGALPFLIPLLVLIWLEPRLGAERRAPEPDTPAWPFDGIVYALAATQLLSIYLLGRMYAQQSLLSMDVWMALLLVGASSGFQIITAHELIHRRNTIERWLGRALLCTVLYEHFYTEHIRGHHVRVGTPDDPATARFGESFRAFYLRTVPAQFRSAWALECKRLGDPDMRPWDPRQLRNRVLHGLLAEAALLCSIATVFGATACVAFVFQAVTASRLLEVVNYFEHWGLVRAHGRVRPIDSWDTHSRFTYYGLIGLSRHADHHAFAARPYQELRTWTEAPLLPRGYVGMIALVLANNRKACRLMTAELRRRNLGPFAP